MKPHEMSIQDELSEFFLYMTPFRNDPYPFLRLGRSLDSARRRSDALIAFRQSGGAGFVTKMR